MDVKAHREACRLQASLKSFNRLLDGTRQAIVSALKVMTFPYIAVSGGKDSTVVLDLVRSIAPDIPAVFSDDEWNYPETIDYLEKISNLARIASTVRHAEWFISWQDGPKDLLPNTVWVDAKQGDGIPAYARARGYDGCFLGLRAQESSVRTLHLRGRGPLHFCKQHGCWEANPIARWRVEDVWAYILSREVPYNKAYDRMTELGIPLAHQRVGPFAVDRVLGYGQVATLKRGWPDLFNRFVARYPEAGGYC